ncbi:hypothetical protein MMC31_007625 [Peltigera leucophlebia]|nr:hypothetical protein [Peltigera leucophlebia]
MTNYGSPKASPIVASENPCIPPPLAYVPMVIPYPGTPGAPFFDGQNITHFLDLYDQLCSDYRLSESEKINRLPWYCEFFTGNYIKILIKESDWVAVRSILRREYKDNDLDQLINSREFWKRSRKSPVPKTMIFSTTANFPTTPNIVEPFKYPAHDLAPPTRFQTLQGTIQEDIPVVRIHESRVGEVKAGEVSTSDNDRFLVSDPTDDFYASLGALFADCKPVDEDLEQIRVSSVSIVEPVEDAAAAKTDPNRPNTKTRKAVREFCILLETEFESMKKTVMGREQERFPGVDGTAVRRPMQRAMECEDHG